MNLFGTFSENKKYLLPLVLLATVLFTFQGISVPNYPNPYEPKLSTPQNANPSTSAVVKTLLQYHQFKVTNTAQFFDFFSYEHQFENSEVQHSVPRYESIAFISSAVPTIPARAPPA